MNNLISVAEGYALKGLSLKKMALDTGISYFKIKSYLRDNKYQHPRGFKLIENRVYYEHGIILKELLTRLIKKNIPISKISRDLKVDYNTTIKAIKLYNIDCPPTKQTTQKKQSKKIISYWDNQREKREFLDFVLKLALWYAKQGLSLKVMSKEKSINYSSLKQYLKWSGYQHPMGLELIENRISYEFGSSLRVALVSFIDAKMSRTDASKALNIDHKTINKALDRYDLDWPLSKPKPKHFRNIIKATNRRQKYRNDLRWITYDGQKKYLSEWALEYSINPSTLARRLNLGYSIKDALNLPKHGRRGFTCLNSLSKYASKQD